MARRKKRNFDRERCFVYAYNAAQVHRNEGPVIVHGQVRPDGKPFMYGWCEVGDSVFDYTLRQQSINKEEFYKDMSISQEKMSRFTFDEYTKLILQKTGYGPFGSFS